MGKSTSAKQSVVDYRMSVHLGISVVADRIRRLLINEKVAWEGSEADPTILSIDKPDLFGGDKKEGGVSGDVYWLPGRNDQTLPEKLAAKLGKTSATAPGFRGLATLFFTGFGNDGFLWSKNSPIFAQNIWITLERAMTGLNPDYQWIDYDLGTVNFAHTIYYYLRDRKSGMGAPESAIDIDTFEAVAETLYNEGWGGAFFWNKQTPIEDLMTELLGHIQGVLYLNPRTGKLTPKLIRDDYDVNDLPVLDATNSKLTSYKQRLWGETINEIVVSYTDPATEQAATVTQQDLANIAAQGEVVSDPRNYYAFRDKLTANKACARELRAAAAPLDSFGIEASREFWYLTPGDVVIANFPDQGINNAVVRLSSVDYGKKKDGAIKVAGLTDIFSFDHAPITATPGSDWVDPSIAPTVLDDTKIFTLPYYFVSSTDLQSSVIDLEYPETLALVLGFSADSDSYNYDLLSRTTLPNGTLGFVEAGTKTLVHRTTLAADLAIDAGTLPRDISDRADRGPRVGGFVIIGDDDATAELLQITDINGDGDWVVVRGALDTVPQAWAAGVKVWFVNPGTKLADDATIRAAGETVHYKMLTRTSKGRLSPDVAPEITATLDARPHLPLRPANVKINGVAFADVSVAATSDIAITWAVRNRTFEDGSVLQWTDPSVAGEYAQHTVIQVFDTSDVKIWEYQGLYVETGITFPKSHFARWSEVRIRVISRLGDLDSLQGYDIRVTGLANNPAAPLPPDPPPLGLPPSPTSPPDAGDYTLTDGPVVNTAGVSQPAFTIAGTPPEGAESYLLIRYRPNVMPIDWRYHAEVAITPTVPVKIDVTAVTADTTYVVEIAYGAKNTYNSDWVSLGTVVTGTLKAGDVTHIGGVPIESVTNDINTSLEQTLQAILIAQNIDLFVQAMTYVGDGRTVQTVALDNTAKTADAIQRLNLLGAMTADASAFVINLATAMVGPQTMAQYITGVQAALDGLTSSVSVNAEAIAGQLAKWTLVADNNGVISAIQLGATTKSFIAFLAQSFGFYDDTDPENPKQLASMEAGKIVLSTDVEIDGDLNVKEGSITENGIAIGSLTNFNWTEYDAAATINTDTDPVVASVDLSTKEGSAGVKLTCDLWISTAHGSHMYVDIYRDSDLVKHIDNLSQYDGASWSIHAIDEDPPAGAHTYTVQLSKIPGDSDAVMEFRYRYIEAWEFKR